jgi:hypothetical protein
MILGRDGIAGLVCLAISLFLLLLTRGLPPPVMVPIGPAFYPRVVLLLLAALSLAMIVMDVQAQRRRRAAGGGAVSAPSGERPNYPLVFATFVVFGLYIAALPELGFRISTFLFVAGLQVTLDWPTSVRRWAIVLAIALGVTLVCYVTFEDYLAVLLPRGRWSGL